MIINHNISSIFANRQLFNNEEALDKNMEKLSSGLRINRSGDDASGLAVSEKMRSQIRGLNQAMRNTMDGVSFIQTTEGYLDETTQVLQRMRELAIQSGNGIYSDEDRSLIDVEMTQLVDEVQRIADYGQFNGMNMLTGKFSANTVINTAEGANLQDANAVNLADPAATEGNALVFHVGPNMDQRVSINVEDMGAAALGLRSTDGSNRNLVAVNTSDSANQSIGLIDKALLTVTEQRANLGALQNRFDYLHKGLYVAYENTQAAESRIRDTDMAREMSDFVKNQILSQSATSMLAQANMKSQMVMSLLQ